MKTDNSILKQALFFALAGVTFSQTVSADQYHYRDILVGDRAAGLAGAYTAIADDPSGQYYNPAGIVYVSSPKLSGSANAYQMKTTEYTNVSKSNPDQKWTRTSSGMVANFFGMVQPLGSGTVGFSIAIPNYELEDQSDEFIDINGSQGLSGLLNGSGITDTTANPATVSRQNIDFNNEDSTTLAGVSYGVPISKTLAVGVTLYGYMRKQETTNWQYVYAKSDDGSKTLDGTFYQKIQTQELGLQPRLGVMWAPTPQVSVGLMMQATFIASQSPEYRNYAKYTVTDATGATILNNQLNTYDVTNASLIPDLNKTVDNDLPLETNLGITYFANDALLYSADFSYATETDRYQATWNAAAGAEYFIDSTWAVRGGLYTNNANTDANVAKLTATGKYTTDPHIDLYGMALSVSRYTKGSSITAGINYSYGSGEANLNENSPTVQDITMNAMNVFVSTSASF